jgi:hypothetical protein
MPSTAALTLHTERLDLLPINRAHALAMFEVLKDATLYEFTGGSPPPDVDTLARLYEFWEHRRSPDGAELWFNWAMRLRTQAELVGHLQAGVLSDHADMAWVLGAKWQQCWVCHRGGYSRPGLAATTRRARNPRLDPSRARGQHPGSRTSGLPSNHRGVRHRTDLETRIQQCGGRILRTGLTCGGYGTMQQLEATIRTEYPP